MNEGSGHVPMHMIQENMETIGLGVKKHPFILLVH